MDQRLAKVRRGIDAVRRFLEPPLEPDAPPIEVRAAALDAIERQVAIVGIGVRVFPHGAVSLRVLVPDAADRAVFERVFADFDARVRRRFEEIRCDVGGAFRARVTLVKAAPAGWADGQRFALEYAKKAETPSPAPVRVPVLVVTVAGGAATKPVYRFQTPLVRIGRMAAARDTRGGVRRNHVAFDEHATGVSRAHARIDYDPARGEYRIVDEGSAKGTRLVRGDTTIDVRARRQDARGVRLETGDEIHLADAVLRITLE